MKAQLFDWHYTVSFVFRRYNSVVLLTTMSEINGQCDTMWLLSKLYHIAALWPVPNYTAPVTWWCQRSNCLQSDLQRFWTSDLERTARRRCFGADIFKFPAPT